MNAYTQPHRGIRTTIHVTRPYRPYYNDKDRVHALQRYAMRRYQICWIKRRIASAERWFNAAERCSRLIRILEAA
jgi:hypothetical protein